MCIRSLNTAGIVQEPENAAVSTGVNRLKIGFGNNSYLLYKN